MAIRSVSSFVFVICLVCVSLYFLLSSHSQEAQSNADIAFLASDAHVVVGDVALVLPFVALTGYVADGPAFSLDGQQDRQMAKERLESFRKAAISPDNAPTVDRLEVDVDGYGFDPPFLGICAQLSRQWSKSVCDDPWAPLGQALPKHPFFLADDRKFETFHHHWTVGGERISEHLLSMNLTADHASVVCDRATSSNVKYCTAGILIKHHLAAVWTVWDSAEETSQRQAEREGKAVAAFVHHALGASENFPMLLSAACELRNPMSGIGPAGNPCDRSPISEPR